MVRKAHEKVIMTIASLVMAGGLQAQVDTLPRSSANQESWYNSELPKDAAPKKDSVELTFGQLPDKIMSALETRKEYRGWQDGRIYYDKVNHIYKLFISGSSSLRVYGIDQEGHEVTFRSERKP